MRVNKDLLQYSLIRILTFPLSFFPYSWIRSLGKVFGFCAFYLMREYRKRTLSNLALAKDLALQEKELLKIAKCSFENLAINCLEYPKLSREKDFSRVIVCENPEIASQIYETGQGIIFFCGHLSNWEVLFLDGTMRMQGIAIGKPIKNKRLYQWILSIREKNGGKIISPRNALREGLRALKKGQFIGIVGDQGMPDSTYCFPFLGRSAWTSTAPALLAYKTNSPIIFAETRRVKGGYRIRYFDPIWPNLNSSLEKETTRMMDQALQYLQESIKASPGEWLWQHNRWKQQTPQNLYKRFRQDAICVILPKNEEALEEISHHLPTLKTIYPRDFLFLMAPKGYMPSIAVDAVHFYQEEKELFIKDYRSKLVFNFTNNSSLHKHFEALSAFEVLNQAALQKLAEPHFQNLVKPNLSDILKRALCRPGSLW